VNGALDGIRVLDLSRVVAGPFASMILGDLGADVIKVEEPRAGDDLRRWGPPFAANGDSTYFQSVNRNKRGIAVDLRTEAGRELIRTIAAEADVVIENFRVGKLDALGLGYDDLRAVNPRLVFCSVSGFGRTGPMAARPGYDVLIQAMSGLMSVTGEPEGEPMRVGVAIVDLCTGLYAAVGILAALQARTSTGLGQRVDLSLLESAVSLLPNLTAGYLIAGEEPARLGTGHPNVTPYGVFPTRDAHIVLAIGNDAQWARFCTAVGQVPDPRYDTNDQRMKDRAALEALVKSWCSVFSLAELTELLMEHQVPHGPVNTVPDILGDAQTKALGLVEEYPLDGTTTGSMVRLPITMSESRRQTPLRPPPLGTDTRPVLRSLGFSDADLERLGDAGAFGPPDQATQGELQ
jgi:crotonobetainyl-CoA:carnitine CoA-transferase CaiB-like acyl-CoA transferase